MALGRGITNSQASYLAALCREAGVPYTGSGMTRLQASAEITRLVDELERTGRRRRRPPAGRTAGAQAPGAGG